MFRTARAFGPGRPLVRGLEDLALVTDNDERVARTNHAVEIARRTGIALGPARSVPAGW